VALAPLRAATTAMARRRAATAGPPQQIMAMDLPLAETAGVPGKRGIPGT
jgi:hypothetical protein